MGYKMPDRNQQRSICKCVVCATKGTGHAHQAQGMHARCSACTPGVMQAHLVLQHGCCDVT